LEIQSEIYSLEAPLCIPSEVLRREVRELRYLQYSPKVLGHFANFYLDSTFVPLLPLNNVGF